MKILFLNLQKETGKAGETVKNSKFQKNGRKVQYRQKNKKAAPSAKNSSDPRKSQIENLPGQVAEHKKSELAIINESQTAAVIEEGIEAGPLSQEQKLDEQPGLKETSLASLLLNSDSQVRQQTPDSGSVPNSPETQAKDSLIQPESKINPDRKIEEVENRPENIETAVNLEAMDDSSRLLKTDAESDPQARVQVETIETQKPLLEELGSQSEMQKEVDIQEEAIEEIAPEWIEPGLEPSKTTLPSMPEAKNPETVQSENEQHMNQADVDTSDQTSFEKESLPQENSPQKTMGASQNQSDGEDDLEFDIPLAVVPQAHSEPPVLSTPSNADLQPSSKDLDIVSAGGLSKQTSSQGQKQENSGIPGLNPEESSLDSSMEEAHQESPQQLQDAAQQQDKQSIHADLNRLDKILSQNGFSTRRRLMAAPGRPVPVPSASDSADADQPEQDIPLTKQESKKTDSFRQIQPQAGQKTLGKTALRTEPAVEPVQTSQNEKEQAFKPAETSAVQTGENTKLPDKKAEIETPVSHGPKPAKTEKTEKTERKSNMPNTSDIKVWKDILSELQSNSEQNQVVIQEIQEEITLQEQRNKLEVKKLYEQIKEQTESLEKLLANLKKDTLFTLPADEATRESFEKTLEERLENSRQLMDYTASLLDTQTTAPETIEKIRFGSRKAKESAVRAQFPRQSLLGNWIHYFTRDMFTCQCFWDDGEFKEYDFRDNRLVEERNGKFHVEDNKVIMDYDEGKQAVYTVTGYSDDCLDYLINKTPIRFDYMPEDLLNTLLEENAR